MATEITTHKWCDLDLATEDARVPGETVTVAINGRKPREIDLCAQHYKEFVQPLLEILGEEGRKADVESPVKTTKRTSVKKVSVDGGQESLLPGTPQDGDLPCPLDCGYSGKRAQLRRHTKEHHDVNLAVLEGKQGHTMEGQPITYWCRVDTCSPEGQAGFAHGAGRAAHERAEHGVDYSKE